jgi:hypothetical protein
MNKVCKTEEIPMLDRALLKNEFDADVSSC